MSEIIIQDEALKRIMADERLRGARRHLSFHELRTIIRHVREADRNPPTDAPEDASHDK